MKKDSQWDKLWIPPKTSAADIPPLRPETIVYRPGSRQEYLTRDFSSQASQLLPNYIEHEEIQIHPLIIDDEDFTYVIYVREGGSDVGTVEDVIRDADHLSFPRVLVDKKPDLIIDLGCNIGATLVSYAAHFPEARIIGFELDDENSAIAKFNTKNHPNITVVRSGVVGRERAGRAIQYDRPSMGWNACRVQDGGLHSAQSICLDSIFHEFYQGEESVLIKMDIEGSEGEVLDDLSTFSGPWMSWIIVEYHFPWSEEEIREKIDKAGFVVSTHPRHPHSLVGYKP